MLYLVGATAKPQKQKSILQKAVVANAGKVTNHTYNLDLGLDWLKVNITYP
ncbi:hypothetical protein [Microcoleus sp.]|uniref:hypothetical protein n=1 Tax=Microcoleus sp. TaxID=44472 RepID=UPI003526470E